MNIGDCIETLNDTLRGHVVRITPKEVTMLTEEGFELTLLREEVVPVHEEAPLRTSFVNIDEESLQKDTLVDRHKRGKGFRPPSTRREKVIPPMEVDLHIEKLVDSWRNMTNYDMLTLQLDTARNQLEFAITKGIKRIVFIHGVGEGVLRSELETLFGRYPNVSFYDAEYAKYGSGATEVYIYQKAK